MARGSTCKQGMEQESSHRHLVQVPLAANAVALLIGGPLSFGWLSVACLIAASATTQQSIVCKHGLKVIVIEARREPVHCPADAGSCVQCMDL